MAFDVCVAVFVSVRIDNNGDIFVGITATDMRRARTLWSWTVAVEEGFGISEKTK